MSDVAAIVLAVSAVAVAWLVTSAWMDVAKRRAAAAETTAEKLVTACDAIAEGARDAAKSLASAWKHRTSVEWEITESPRAARERVPAPDPVREDPRMAPLEAWLAENPVSPPSRDNLRGCYAVVMGVREATRARREECRVVVDGYGVPVPDGV